VACRTGYKGTVKVPYEIYREISVSTGPLHDWLTDAAVSQAMLLQMMTDPNYLNQVVTRGYAPDLNDSEIEEIGQDPFLIAYALVNPAATTIVTKEVSAPSKQRANRRIPDVCRAFGIRCINDFDFYRELDFKIA
jgi:carbamoylphosphate synthase small subunit